MATNLFTDKDTSNWFKASIALNVAKQGLTNFLDTQLQNVHAIVGKSCGNCPIEKLIPCPTKPYCNKKKRNYCSFHKSQKPQPCPTCDNVKQNIISQHRYSGPSWRNTRAENWTQDYWEIGKCFLPPDGYTRVRSVQESDFNGVISILLNCLHFKTCLSCSCMSPPPPDQHCLLEKVRQIGRDVRHTSDCKVTDADLQDYFQTLSTLLADPNCLQHDPTAILACTRLRNLQNDLMSIEELGELFKEAYRMFKHAKEAGERFSDEAERTFAKANAYLKCGEQRLKKKTQDGEQRLTNQTHSGQRRLKRKTKDGLEHIERQRQVAEQCLERKIKDGTQRIEYTMQDSISRMQQEANKTSQVEYEQGKAEFHELLIDHYRWNQSTVSVSPIWDGHDKPIHTVFVRPNLIHIKIENDGSRRKTNNEVLQYKDLFYKENKLNKRVIIQGEPGMGKTTLLSKFVLDWCEAASPESQEYSANFSDLETLQAFKFLFHLSLRDSPETLDVVQMIKIQLINYMYADEDEREQVYKLLQHIMKTEKCIICLDGLNEWAIDLNSDPFPFIATGHKQCVALITTRPWKMADKRIKDSGIDLLIEVSGIMDKKQLANFVIKSLQTNNSKSYAEFMLYVEEKKLHHFLASPWLLTLLVSVWINSQHLSGSLCVMNCILLDNLFRKATKREGKFSNAQFPCLKGTNFIYPQVEILNSLAKLAFECTFSSGKSLVFSKEKILESLSQEHLKFSLQAGILSERLISSIQSEFSFLHETVQEFLAAFHIAKSNDILISSILETKRHVLEISQVFMYLCGLNTEKANTLSDPAVNGLLGEISNGVSRYVKGWYDQNNISVFHTDNTNLLNIVPAKRNGTENYDVDFNARCVSKTILFQSMLIAGFKEAEASEQNVSYLVCNDFIFHEYLHDSELVDLKSMLMANASRVRSLIVQSNTLQTKEILTVLQLSKACLSRLVIPGHHELCGALRDLKITELVLKLYIDEPMLSDVIQSLSMLSYLKLAECNLHDELYIPVALKYLELYDITCSAGYLSRLLVRLSSLDHCIQCWLYYCSVESEINITKPANDKANTDVHVVHSELVSCNMSRIELYVRNGNRDLYELLRGTSIGTLALKTTDDVSLAADILPTLGWLETLFISDTFQDRLSLQLPPTLDFLFLNDVACSTEWFVSLLIKLSSLQHKVCCDMFDVAVNTSYAEEGLDVSLSDLQNELLSCDMSRITLFVRNGSKDLYELLRGTSISILILGTTADISLAADILPTLSWLEKLTLCGTVMDRSAVQLPPAMISLSLDEVKCSTEWFGSLLIKLSSLQHPSVLNMCDVTLNTSYTEVGLDATLSVAQNELLSSDMCRIVLEVSNGSRDLYELLRGTSIRTLQLRTTDDVSLAADILPTLSKLEVLNIWGTFKDRCAIQLPPTLQRLSLQEVECSTEWLGSLLMKLSSLQHKVHCDMFDIAVNTNDAEDGHEMDTSSSVMRKELLKSDLSHVILNVSNGSKDLYQLLRGTSLGTLMLKTSEDVSLAADVLLTHTKLESRCGCSIV